ncbi:MAG: hypothetical protein ACKVP7_16970 [Hyphomicrobiaceae bacterium]
MTQPRPTLHLSGAKLRTAWATLVHATEAVGGVERFVAALHIKSQAFQDRFANDRAVRIERVAFDEIAQLMPTVRRRVGGLIDRHGWPHVCTAIVALLHDAHVPGSADARIAAFESALATSRETVSSSPSPRSTRGEGRGEGRQQTELEQAAAPHPNPLPVHVQSKGRGDERTFRPNDRFLRDLAAEILHNVLPEHYPLMTRWMWDTKANTGVIREIWHDPTTGDDTDHIVIEVPDTHETFLVLREELSQFLSDQGIFRDMLWYIDVLSAQIYAGYINSQGGAWLKTEFASEGDPLEHTRRILGLDARGTGLRARRPRTGDPAIAEGAGKLLAKY